MKKSFVLYYDQRNVFEALSEKECKELVLAIFDYAEGKEDNLSPLVNIAFLSIKNQLKRDFEKWEDTREQRKIAGSKGGKQKAANLANATFAKQIKQNLANVAVNVNDNVNVIKEKHNSLKSSEHIDHTVQSEKAEVALVEYADDIFNDPKWTERPKQ